MLCSTVLLKSWGPENVNPVIVMGTAFWKYNMYTFFIGSPLLICVVSMTSSLGSYGEVDK